MGVKVSLEERILRTLEELQSQISSYIRQRQQRKGALICEKCYECEKCFTCERECGVCVKCERECGRCFTCEKEVEMRRQPEQPKLQPSTPPPRYSPSIPQPQLTIDTIRNIVREEVYMTLRELGIIKSERQKKLDLRGES